MDDERIDPANPSGTEKPENWDREEMKADFGDDADAAPPDEDDKVRTWKENQMARERQDGTRTPGLSEEEIAESEGGLSGGGANPGGGERWAERDVEK
jgi:hypothetical protein